MDEYLTHNLTGRVIKVEGDYFAYGGYGDIWKGKLTKSDSDYVDVRTYLLAGPPFFSILILGCSEGPKGDLDQH